MPELPEVEVVRCGLERLILNRRICDVLLHRQSLRYPMPNGMAERLVGHRVVAITRRGKYLLFHLDGAEILCWHLGMTGQFHVLPNTVDPGRHEHVTIALDNGATLRYRDARRFGYAGIFPKDGWKEQPWFVHLGPEPLEGGFNCNYFLEQCASRAAPVKQLLMNANVVVGVGNIYACEALFRAGIDPFLSSRRLKMSQADTLVIAVKAILTDAINAGGSTISDFVQADGHPGYFSHSFSVYQREGKPCTHCGTPIRRRLLSGRSTFYCSICQN